MSKKNYEETGKRLGRFDMNGVIVELKKKNPRFKTVYSQVLQNQADRLSKSFDNFFRRCKEKSMGAPIKVGYPRYKKSVHSITYTQHGFKLIGGKLEVNKIGRIPIVLHRPLPDKVKMLTISRSASGQWYAIFTCEVEVKEVIKDGPEVGIDQGLKSFIHCSDGLSIEPPKLLRKAEKKLAKEQRKLSRKKKGSENRRKQKLKVAKVNEKVANQRDDWLHKLSRHVVSDYCIIVVEDLDVQGMLHNHRLAKSIYDASWTSFVSMLEYKVSETGARVVKVDPRNTTQTCSKCGNIRQGEDKLAMSDRIYECPVCGMSMDRDLNAAKNILARAGMARSHACGDDVRLPLEGAVVVEAGTICSEIRAGSPRQ